MRVGPTEDTTYAAVVVFGTDTFPLTGTVRVHEKYDKDTLYETVCSSPHLYTSAVNPIFKDMDISTPHDFEPVRLTLQTIHGCDSIITLMLKVNASYLFTDNVVVCISDTPYTWRGRSFSETGTYYDSLSTVCCSCDSVYQLNLIIAPLPEISTDFHVGVCEGASVTLSASSTSCSDLSRKNIHEGFNRVSGNESNTIAGNLSTMTDYISTGQYVYPVGTTAIKIGSSNYAGYITTKTLDLSHDYTLTLKCKGNYNTNNPDNEYDARLQILVNNVIMDTLIIPANKDNHGYEPFVVSLPAATASSTIKLQTLSEIIPGNAWAEKRVLIDDILIEDNTPCSYVWWRGTSDTVSHEATAIVTPNVSAPLYEERYYVQATSAHGCKSQDSTLVVNLQLPLEESAEICSNELPFTWRDTIFEEGTAMNGTYVFHRTSVAGCDSVVTLTLTIYEVPRDTVCANISEDAISILCDDRTISKKNSTQSSLPLDNYYRNSCSQQIFTSSEIGQSGKIDKISFNYAYSSPTTVKNKVKIYLAHTNKSTFASTTDWMSPSSMTLVYSGNMNCSNGWNDFNLTTPFDYNGTDNLMVMVLDSSNSYNGSSYKFYCTNASGNKVLSWRSDSEYWSTSKSGSLQQIRSDIRFHACQGTYDFADKTFIVEEPGLYTIIDTLTGSNGCDSITVRYLVVNPPHEDEICDSTYTPEHTWEDNVEPYCWIYNGKSNCISGKTTDAYGYYEFPGKKTFDGVEIDTISYLKLTINPTSRDTDTVKLCIFEEPTLTTYEINGADLTLSMTGSYMTITNSVPGVEVDTIDAANGDFVFKMKTVKGCDSILTVHFDRVFVQRDTIYNEILLEAGSVICSDPTISNQNSSTYYMPVNNSNRYSCSQQIFTPAEIGTAGIIKNISFNYSSSNTMTAKNNVKIYLAHTNKSSFSNNNDWSNPSGMTLVYSGNLNCNRGWNTFTLSNTFEYNGSDNLMVMIHDESNNYNGSSYSFYYTNVTDYKSLYYYSNSYDWTPTSTSGTRNRVRYRSDIRFNVCSNPVEFANKTFQVTEPGTYIITDTVSGSNGCDSITTRVLIVERPHYDTICVEEFPNYTWHSNPLPASTNTEGYYEFYGKKVINGTEIDTISYLKLDFFPSPEVSLASVSDVCPEADVTLTATVTTPSKADYTYEWSGDLSPYSPTSTTVSSTSSTTTATIPDAPASCGNSYTVNVKVTDGNGCEATDNATVSVKIPAKPTILTTLTDNNLDCNPTVPVLTENDFTVNDECDAAATVKLESAENAADCQHTKVWTATYVNACGLKADTVKVTYTWTEDTENPVISVVTNSNPAGVCNPTIVAPTFKVNDNCDGELALPSDSVTTTGKTGTGCEKSQTWTAHYTDPCGNKAENVSVTYTWTEDTENPVISVVTNSNPAGVCNPTIVAPTFKVNDNCVGELALPSDSIIDGGVVNTTACGRSQTWTAHYTDPCGNKAADVSVTYTWTEDHTVPEIHTEAVSDHKGCNPTIVAPTFTVIDNCEGTFVLSADSITTTGKTGTGCEKSQSWTAHYTDGCGNPAAPLTVTYSWKEDSQKPVIATTATDSHLGCDPTTIIPPTFTVSDNCEGDFALPADSVTDGGVVAVTGEPHKFSRTWTAHFTDLCGNKADNVSVTYTWVEAPTVTITCPPTVNKTLAYGDCVMNIYPTEIGTPIVNAPSDWPMTVSNNIPADNLYYEGETEITWVATDGICGYSVSCEQKVIVVFPQCPTAVDCEGNVYQSVRIGCDCWTQTNLVSNCYGDANECVITGNCDEPIPCVMEYETPMHPDVDVNVATFGKLYCDTAVLKDSVVNPHGHVQGICPEGWYLPTAAQYDELNLYGADALKSPFYWTDGGGTNTTDFSWLPAGWYNGALQRFEGMLSEGYFWAVEVVHGEVNISAYLIHHDCDSVLRGEAHTGLGSRVRCIKEKE